MTEPPSSAPPAPSALPDAFSSPAAGDAFEPLTPETERRLWTDLRQVLTPLIDRPATPRDRETAEAILRRLNLDTRLGPLFVVALREDRQLAAIVEAGAGADAKVRSLEQRVRALQTVAPPADSEAAERLVAERDRLQGEHLAATRLRNAAALAARQRQHCRLWLWCLFGDTDPFKETKDFSGNLRLENAGALAGLCAGRNLDYAARQLGLDPFRPNSWRLLRAAEPGPAPRRFRSLPVSTPTTFAPSGQIR